jgi:hypothetical protein
MDVNFSDFELRTQEAMSTLRSIFADARKVLEAAEALPPWAADSAWRRKTRIAVEAIVREAEADAKAWAASNADAAEEVYKLLNEQLTGLNRYKAVGRELGMPETGMRGYQLENEFSNPYLAGMDAPSDKWSPEEIVALNAPRAPQWFDADAEFEEVR